MSKQLKILVAVLLICGAFFAYRSHSNKTYLSNSIKCRDVGMDTYNEEVKANVMADYYDPQFYFAKDSSTCLYKGAYTTTSPNGDSSTYYFIKDVYRNKIVASRGTGFYGTSIGNEDLDLWDEVDGKYFGK
jgi:hypothetical protein